MCRYLAHSLVVSILVLGMLIGLTASPPISTAQNASTLTAWANDGGDKVTQDELRASSDPSSVQNSVWNGESIQVFGARNEVVAFNVILESPDQATTNVSISFDQLVGPDGASISSTPAQSDGLFDWTSRNIELFYVRYLEIKGLSLISYETYDERHIPERFRRPYDESGEGSGTWEDRPDHNKFYPDIAVPFELVPTFDIAAGQNQSLWVDIYIPKESPAGVYQGTLSVQIDGTEAHTIPVELTVRDFTLPDVPSAPTMLFLSYEDVNRRYLGDEYPDDQAAINSLRDIHFLVAHRHRISLIGDEFSSSEGLDQPGPAWISRLNGTLFTPENGYDGPGVGIGNGVYSIGTYGSWGWQDGDEAAMWEHADNWVTWFDENAPNTEYFLYLIDESEDFPQTEQWASWVTTNPGPGSRLLSFATIALPDAVANTPSLSIATSWSTIGLPEVWQQAAEVMIQDPNKRAYLYNGQRPGSGTFATEDDGVALRQIAWSQFKMEIDRWFFWESTYYNDYQGGTGQTNVFQTAHTFGSFDEVDSVHGETGWNYSNGDGVLFYPGTDTLYPDDSYGVMGPFASLRMKHWRRGIQDVDYLTMAASIDPDRVNQIVETLIPTVLWEVGVEDPSEPNWVLADISWSTDPDVWEAARAELADIIESGQ